MSSENHVPFTQTGEEVLYQNKHIKVTDKHLVNEKGENFSYSVISRAQSKQIVCALLLNQDDIVLVEQYRIPHEKHIIEQVAGLVEHGLSLEETVVNESIQEAGYRVEPDQLHHMGQVTTSAGLTNEILDLYIATGAQKDIKQDSGEPAENITVKTIPQDEFFDRLLQVSAKNLLDSKLSHNILLGALRDIGPLRKMLLKKLLELEGQKNISIHRGERTREFVAKQSRSIYVFGDNIEDHHSGYVPEKMQAVIRGLPNAFGIDTKKKRGDHDDAYFSDADLPMFIDHLEAQLKSLKKLAAQGSVGKKIIVFPADGIGTGKAMLATKAPAIFAYLNRRLKEEFGFDNGRKE